jgi:hypothetical protein
LETIGEMTLEEAARKAAGNWRSWTCFVWDRQREITDPENWSILYTHNRDSGLLDQSNAEVIAKALTPFTTGEDANVVLESHAHWAVGHVDGFSIRVYRAGEITDAFRTYHALCEQQADYSVLDESDYAEREHEATLDNVADASWRLKSQYKLPEGWDSEIYSWLSDHRPGSVENRDDRGGYPSEADLQEAFDTLGYERVEV